MLHEPQLANDDSGNRLHLGNRNLRCPGPDASRLLLLPAPGNYATTQGTVNIPAAGYYYNVPLYAVPAPVNPAPAQGFTYSSFYYPPNSSSFNASANRPAQGSTYSYSYSSFYYPRGGASTEGGGGPAYEGDERPSGAYVSGDNEDNPDW